jgi:hypothetical protein
MRVSIFCFSVLGRCISNAPLQTPDNKGMQTTDR